MTFSLGLDLVASLLLVNGLASSFIDKPPSENWFGIAQSPDRLSD